MADQGSTMWKGGMRLSIDLEKVSDRGLLPACPARPLARGKLAIKIPTPMMSVFHTWAVILTYLWGWWMKESDGVGASAGEGQAVGALGIVGPDGGIRRWLRPV